jgi:hypothetical protein
MAGEVSGAPHSGYGQWERPWLQRRFLRRNQGAIPDSR